MKSNPVPISLSIHENGYWRDTENTIAVFDGFSNVPQVFQDIISQIDISKHHVVSKQSIKAPTNAGLIPLYRLTNTLCNQSIFRADHIDAALQYNNPDMYLIHDSGMCLIEHDEGYVLVCSVSVGGDSFWMIEGDIEDVQEGNWIINEG
ncbi:MAG: hypothetical protein ABFD07_16585 [Methanobacterium sp.]